MGTKGEGGFNLNIGSIHADQSNVGQTVHATQNIYGKDEVSFAGEIMQIIGNDQFGLFDQVALKNAGARTVIVQANVTPYFELLRQELDRQREDNKVLKLWHFSGHGDSTKGIQFGKDWVDWKVFRELISPYDELDILFLSACSSINVADAVTGPFKYVLACAVDIPNTDAVKAAEIFWRNIIREKSPEEAFEATKINVPHFAPNLRMRGI